jgi:hypothetical protein
MIYMLNLSCTYILVCYGLMALPHGCVLLGGVPCINHAIKLILLIIVENFI